MRQPAMRLSSTASVTRRRYALISDSAGFTASRNCYLLTRLKAQFLVHALLVVVVVAVVVHRIVFQCISDNLR
jgi:hypothetical protein